MVIFEVDSNSLDKPLFAEFLYKHYPYDALDFEIDVIKKTMSLLEQLYPGKEPTEMERMHRILHIQTLSKFCQFGEILAAFAIAFQSTYANREEEIASISAKISKYNIGQVVDFYNNIHKRNTEYVAKLFGYPPLDLQSDESRSVLQLSSNNLRESLDSSATGFISLDIGVYGDLCSE